MTHTRFLTSLGAVALAGALALSGCGNNSNSKETTAGTSEDATVSANNAANDDLTDEEIIAKVKETAEQSEQLSFNSITRDLNVHMESSAQMTGEGIPSQSMTVTLDARADNDNQTMEMSVKGNLGSDQQVDTTSYFQYEGDTLTAYINNGGVWQTTAVSADEISQAGEGTTNLATITTLVDGIDKATVTRGEDSYTLTTDLDPSLVKTMFDYETDAESVGTLTISVDAETFEIYELTLEMDMNIEDNGSSGNIVMNMNMTSERDADETVEIPAEALEAAGTAGAGDSSSSDN
ncbi:MULTISPECIES: DUF6612 family protein [unclassified Actinobaculum]|uniref:DUF6612 family protein n=1 Tax=unclassified Actinobaculum TaxID=2609299 RepID=UPI000D52711D|nr:MULTISPECIES: DUF6612 family protein [unclassified Actinobaculum]AWE43165.1 hypothetical protein DDD63_10890 [Actinobaculum sp. 313]RTE48275.1 hypothetical protein EKN07_10310 [Actinobaculum sp. 352]